MAFTLAENGLCATILADTSPNAGIPRVAAMLAEDIERVCSIRPKIVSTLDQIETAQVLIAGIIDKSPLLIDLTRRGSCDFSSLHGKRECYQLCIVDSPFPEKPSIKKALLVAGSDKRGCIYGLLSISEKIGVSPMVWIGDVNPQKQQRLSLDIASGETSKEPSVRYRGFFINDEWPAFGNWCTEHFGGVNAKAYEKIFELLLRLKGNYLWPAMWNSSFSQDGPGIENARLADELGVIMGASHHEPMCRAGVEWQQQYKNFSEDNTWDFARNEKGITQFWKEGVERNKNFENVITIGMRGESDSKLLAEGSTMADNIAVLKKAISVQHRLIRETVNENLAQVPRMLAIYKEVEDYFLGDESCEGLKDWKELEDVLFLLADDNFGHLRALPPGPHPGGYGMYYHFDYHGAPVSYEWQNSTRLPKVWEQMCRAYESGVRDMWIVNVGDIKGVEYPLNYFMDLAYDFDKWGSTNPHSAEEYARAWIDRQFGTRLSSEHKIAALDILQGFSRWNALRRPEAMSPDIYHPFHYDEAERVWKEVSALEIKAKELRSSIPAECLTAFDSLIYYPAAASLNMILINVEAGLNAALAKRGCCSANGYLESIRARIARDSELVLEYHAMADGKWCHMMDSPHSGFRSWDAYDWTWPLLHEVVPIAGGKLVAGFRNSSRTAMGDHWQHTAPLSNEAFTRPDTREVLFDLDSRGAVPYNWTVELGAAWLSVTPQTGRHDPAASKRSCLSFTCNRSMLSEPSTSTVCISIVFDNGEKTHVNLSIKAAPEPADLPKNHYLEAEGYISIAPGRYLEKQDLDGAEWKLLPDLGRMGPALRSFPIGQEWPQNRAAPFVVYGFRTKQAGDYTIEFHLSSRNPGVKGHPDQLRYSVNTSGIQSLETVSKSFYTEWHHEAWNKGVMNNIRTVSTQAPLCEGDNTLTLYASGPGVILEKIVLYPAGTALPASYMGPPESWYRS